MRVREALAIGIDRERLSADEMGGATEPAKRFLPEIAPDQQEPVVNKSEVLRRNTSEPRELLAEAGFPGGEGFPTIRAARESQRTATHHCAVDCGHVAQCFKH